MHSPHSHLLLRACVSSVKKNWLTTGSEISITENGFIESTKLKEVLEALELESDAE